MSLALWMCGIDACDSSTGAGETLPGSLAAQLALKQANVQGSAFATSSASVFPGTSSGVLSSSL